MQANSPNRQMILPASNNQQRPSPNVINNTIVTNSPSMNNVQIRQNQTNAAFLHTNTSQIPTTITSNNGQLATSSASYRQQQQQANLSAQTNRSNNNNNSNSNNNSSPMENSQ